LGGAESGAVLRFRMSIENPFPDTIRGVNFGVSWFETSKIEGDRYQKSETGQASTVNADARPL